MRTLRSRLVLAFLVATLLPLGATIWIAQSLLDRSLAYANADDVDRLSRTLENAVRQFYQRERDALKRDASSGRSPAAVYMTADIDRWPEPVRSFWDSGERERFAAAGDRGDRIEYFRRADQRVELFTENLGSIRMQDISDAYGRARAQVDALQSRDLRRGFTLTLLLLVALVWIGSLAPLFLIAHRVSRPIRQLTDAMTGFAGGDWERRLPSRRDDEIGRAVRAFNDMAGQLRRNRDRLVYLAQMTSWQTLARKTAHEVKNSLTPIRLTVEEMLARQPAPDREFMTEAARIVVSEIETLERRVRAFSELASEPPISGGAFDVNTLVQERIALLTPARPNTCYAVELGSPAEVETGADLVKGILTNLLENAADAAGPGGTVLTKTAAREDAVVVEIHDSGPGLSDEASRTLFEPTITFKKHGMGLGLSIARKNALLLGGDLELIPGALGGAAFRITLPVRRSDGAHA